MTLIYKKKVEINNDLLKESNFQMIINNEDKELIKTNWFKGSRNRGFR